VRVSLAEVHAPVTWIPSRMSWAVIVGASDLASGRAMPSTVEEQPLDYLRLEVGHEPATNPSLFGGQITRTVYTI